MRQNLRGLLIILVAAAVLTRPTAPRDTRYTGGSIGGALAVLAEADEQLASAGHDIFDPDYEHWSKSLGGDPLKRLNLQEAKANAPIVAGMVGLAALTGLRDLAAISLYLKFNEVSHTGDDEMTEICLRVIPLIDPHFVEAYTIYAYVQSFRNIERARSILLQGVRWNPEDWELYWDLAWLYLRRTKINSPDPAKALPFLECCTKVKHPYFAERLYAMVLAHLGKRDKAISVLQNLLNDPGLPMYDRQQALRDLDEVRKGFDRVMERILKNKRVLTKKAALKHHHHHHGQEHHDGSEVEHEHEQGHDVHDN